MFDQQFPQEVIDGDPELLGVYLLHSWVVSQARVKGIATEDITPEIRDNIILATQTLDSDKARHAPLEKSLKKAASGDFFTAGILFRELMYSGAVDEIYQDEFLTGNRRQKINAMRPRTRRRSTNKGRTIEEMRIWRRDGHKLNEFIDAAENGAIEHLKIDADIDGINIDWTNTPDWDGEKPKDYTHKALESWWTKSR